MSLMPAAGGGHYNDKGHWVRTRLCFVDCGADCTCNPPLGQEYSAAHDKSVSAAQAQPAEILPVVDPWDSWKPDRTIA